MPFIGRAWLQASDGVPCLCPWTARDRDPATIVSEAVLKRITGGTTDRFPVKCGGRLGNTRCRKPIRRVAGIPSCCSKCDRIGPGAGFSTGAVGPDPPLISGIGQKPAYRSIGSWKRASGYSIPGAIWSTGLHRITLGAIDRVPAKGCRIVCDIRRGGPGRGVAYRWRS